MFAQLAQLGFSVGGALLGNSASKKAEKAAREAAARREAAINEAINVRSAGTERALGYLSPYEEMGRGGQNLLADALGINGPEAQRAFYANFQDDPGFDAVQSAGVGAVEQSRAVSGGLKSGATMKALMDYGQRLKQSVFQDRLNRLSDVGKTGATTATNMASLTDSGSRDIANFKVGIGDAQAGGIIGASNAQQAGTQNMLQMMGYGMGAVGGMGNDLFKRLPGTLPSSGGPGLSLTNTGGLY